MVYDYEEGDTVWCRDCREVPCMCGEDWEEGEPYLVLPSCACGVRVSYPGDILCGSCQGKILLGQLTELRAKHNGRHRLVWALAHRVVVLGQAVAQQSKSCL